MASWFNRVLFKLHGAQKWPWADATVFDYTVGEPGRYGNRRVEVGYSFWIESHIYSGIAVWHDSSALIAYSKNDVIQIQYNPSDPNESYFPEQEDLTTTFFLTLFGAAVALAVCLWMGIGLLHP